MNLGQLIEELRELETKLGSQAVVWLRIGKVDEKVIRVEEDGKFVLVVGE